MYKFDTEFIHIIHAVYHIYNVSIEVCISRPQISLSDVEKNDLTKFDKNK